MKKQATLAGATVVLATGLGLGAAGWALAETPSPTPSSSASSSCRSSTGTPADGDRGDRGHHRGGPPAEGMAARGMAGGMAARGVIGTSLEELATATGKTEAEVRAAVKKVADTTRPTDQERTTMRSKTETERQAPRDAVQARFVKALATELGVDEATVTTAVEQSRTAQVAEHQAELQTRLDQAVTDGTLTQAEADAVAKAVEKGVIGGRGGR